MGGVFGGGGGSSSKTTTTTTNETVLNNDTEINVSSSLTFDFEELAKIYRDRLNFDIEQSLAENDGVFTDEQKIKIAQIALNERSLSLNEQNLSLDAKNLSIEEQNLQLQAEALAEQKKNNTIIFWLTLTGIILAWLGLKKK